MEAATPATRMTIGFPPIARAKTQFYRSNKPRNEKAQEKVITQLTCGTVHFGKKVWPQQMSDYYLSANFREYPLVNLFC